MYFQKILFLWILLASSVFANSDYFSETLSVVATPEAQEELFYHVNYHVDCKGPQSQGLPGLAGVVFLPEKSQKTIRFDLFQGKHQALVSLGPVSSFPGGQVTVQAHQNTQCSLHFLQTQLVYKDLSDAHLEENMYLMALKHSPYLVIREDQYLNRSTDVPLELVYSTWKNIEKKTVHLRYTYFFSDEDSKKTASAVDDQMARYGRMTDVEWIYEVVFKEGKVVDSRYQGGADKKIWNWQLAGDHSDIPMKGQYWGVSQHPILYNVANNNVFSDTPYGRNQKQNYVAYHPGLFPENRIDFPNAREQFQISDHGLYMYLVSEVENRNENKLPTRPSEYLYFLVSGELLPDQTPFNINNGAFKLEVTLTDLEGRVVHRALSSKSVDRLGEDLFGRESIAAVRISSSLLNALKSGKLKLDIAFHDARELIASSLIKINSWDAFTLIWDEELGRYKKVDLLLFQ